MVKRKNAELADLADTAARAPERLLANAKRAIGKAKADAAPGKTEGRPDGGRQAAAGPVRAVNDLTELLDATRRIAARTRQQLTGTIPEGATRRVSLRDPDARPIA